MRRDQSILVTGGAGYIGSHTCKRLANLGFTPVTYDNLSLGHRSAVKWGPLVIGDISDSEKIQEAISRYDVSAVIHFAASAYVGESILHPRKYFDNNLVKTIKLLDSILDAGVRTFVFSSTCATYGLPLRLPIDEEHPQKPINPYGASKLAVERVLECYAQAYNLRTIALRYFNAAGADPQGEIGEQHELETHLIPLALRSVLPEHPPLRIFGCNHPTKDGTAIRDYVHVNDLAAAHALALEYLEAQACGFFAMNLGTGNGRSVRDVILAVEKVTGRKSRVEEVPDRPGDPPELCANASLARQELGWVPAYEDLDRIVSDAWRWTLKLLDPPEIKDPGLLALESSAG